MTTSVQKFCGVKGLYSITNLEIIIEDRGTNLEVDSLRFPPPFVESQSKKQVLDTLQ